MVVISAGMQKSGSAYIYNLINDLLVNSGSKDARKIKEKYGLNEVMKWHNNNVGHLSANLLLKLLFISLRVGNFSVKTHSGPTKFHNTLIKLGLLKTIYIYRDPRDVLLSAQDHGKKIIEKGENHTFANCVNFENAFKEVKSWINIFHAYYRVNGVLALSYEKLLSDPIKSMETICSYLNIKVSEEDKLLILKKYDMKNPKADMTGLHFNKAIVNRYKNEFSELQLQLFKNQLGNTILDMGYEV